MAAKIRFVILICVTLSVVLTSVFAQPNPDYAAANAVLNEARNLADNNDSPEGWKAAEAKFEEAYRLFIAATPPEKKNALLLEFASVLRTNGNVHIDAKRYAVGERYLNFVLEKLRAAGLRADVAVLTEDLGNSATIQGKRKIAIEYYNQALPIYIEVKNRDRVAFVQRQLGLIAYDENRYDAAIEHLTEAAAVYKETKYKEKEAVAVIDLADAYYEKRDAAKAQAAYQNGLDQAAELKNLHVAATAKMGLGRAFYLQYRTEEAIKNFEEALDHYRSVKNAEQEATARLRLGKAYQTAIRNDDARRELQASAEMFKTLNNTPMEAEALFHLGIVELVAGNHDVARQHLVRALSGFLATNNQNGAAMVRLSLADAYAYANEHQKALEIADLAKQHFEKTNDAGYLSAIYSSIGGIYAALSRYDEAIRHTLKAFEFAEQSGDSRRQADTLVNLGVAYSSLGMNAKAIEYYTKARGIANKTNYAYTIAICLNNIGYNYFVLEDLKNARTYLEQAIAELRRLELKREEGFAVHNLGMVFSDLGDYQTANAKYEEALKIYIEVKDRRVESFAYMSLGEVQGFMQQWDKSLANLEKAVGLAREVKYADVEANALSIMMDVWQKRSQPRLAVLYGKQAVNLFQRIRSENKALEKTALTAYLKANEESYRQLADLLVGLGRLPEAQRVYGLLKEEEIFEYVQRDASEAEKLLGRVDLRAEEADALKRYNAIAEKIGSLGAEFGKLQQAKNSLAEGVSLAAADQRRYDELAKQLEEANTAFQVFLRQLAEEFAKKPSVVAEVQENAGLQADLRSWGEGVVSLYTIAGEDRYRVILTTPDIQTDGKTEIKAADLNKKIADFRAAIQNPRVDPRPLGKELYDIIVKPIEKQLEGAKAKTLLWSLDGALRYVPLAALWDGKQYFGQKYQNVLITLASRTRLAEDPKSDWRVLGLGVTAAKEVTEPNGTRILTFSALPSVGTELGAIVRDEQRAGDAGILVGKQLLDAEFTEQALKDRLGRGYQAVHIASHFSFRPGDMTRSFLLLGDGKALTMDKVKTSPQLKFSGVELLTLSACDTAVGDADANGKEIESFGVIAQQNGAKAVMATLWPVADESTSKFMAEFYRLKKENPQMTKAEAIRLAQKQMIEGKIVASGTTGTCRADEFVTAGKDAQFKCDPNAPFSHPYFWSPFVLIGNWR